MFKVVRIQSLDPKVLVSACALGQAQITYIPDEWVYPPEFISKTGNGIFVFSELCYAKDYMDYLVCFGERYETWQCEIQQSTHPIKMYELDWLRNGWIVFDKRAVAFNGTVMATKVKLLRKIV